MKKRHHHRSRESWEKWADLVRSGLKYTVLEVDSVDPPFARCGFMTFDCRAVDPFRFDSIVPGRQYRFGYVRAGERFLVKTITEFVPNVLSS